MKTTCSAINGLTSNNSANFVSPSKPRWTTNTKPHVPVKSIQVNVCLSVSCSPPVRPLFHRVPRDRSGLQCRNVGWIYQPCVKHNVGEAWVSGVWLRIGWRVKGMIYVVGSWSLKVNFVSNWAVRITISCHSLRGTVFCRQNYGNELLLNVYQYFTGHIRQSSYVYIYIIYYILIYI